MQGVRSRVCPINPKKGQEMLLLSPTIIYRNIGEYTHFLNYTSGDVISFDKDDGSTLIQNLSNLTTNNLSDELSEFFRVSHIQLNSRRFRSTLVELGMKFLFPTTVNIELNRRCSLRCQHCYISSDELKNSSDEYFDTLSVNQIDKLLNDLIQMGVFLVVLTGGEPLLNKNIEYFIRSASEKQLVVEIFSNLQFLPDWFKQTDLSNTSIGRIQTSVYSYLPEIHDNVTGRVGSLKRTIDSLKWLRDKGYYIEVATPLMNLNFEHRIATETFFIEMGIPHAFSWPIMNEYYAKPTGKSLLNITKEQFWQICQEKPDFVTKIDCTDSDSPICAAGNALFSISANGDIFPCSQYPKKVGNLFDTPICNIWLSPAMRKIAQCRLEDVASIHTLHNFCMGNNFSETGYPFQVPMFLQEIFAFYDQKEV